eukprot:TRINITY_DN4995_c0_g1_i5.p1 TRINITY_DN4995_c0_g1~~TRINITY_DN4995_c0_g1_i5.p1  ORF type:complete len:596 (-),score=107.06 TRINITY_DN4995_c0_g1_i5:40-1827(-)
MKSLKQLTLNDNALDFLPTTIGKLTNLTKFVVLPNPLPDGYKETDISQLLAFIKRQDVIPDQYKEQKKQRQDKKRDLLLSSGLLGESDLVLVKEIRNILDVPMGKEELTAFAEGKGSEFVPMISFLESYFLFRSLYPTNKRVMSNPLTLQATAIFRVRVLKLVTHFKWEKKQLKNIFQDERFPSNIHQFVFDRLYVAVVSHVIKEIYQPWKQTSNGKKVWARIFDASGSGRRISDVGPTGTCKAETLRTSLTTGRNTLTYEELTILQLIHNMRSDAQLTRKFIGAFEEHILEKMIGSMMFTELGILCSSFEVFIGTISAIIFESNNAIQLWEKNPSTCALSTLLDISSKVRANSRLLQIYSVMKATTTSAYTDMYERIRLFETKLSEIESKRYRTHQTPITISGSGSGYLSSPYAPAFRNSMAPGGMSFKLKIYPRSGTNSSDDAASPRGTQSQDLDLSPSDSCIRSPRSGRGNCSNPRISPPKNKNESHVREDKRRKGEDSEHWVMTSPRGSPRGTGSDEPKTEDQATISQHKTKSKASEFNSKTQSASGTPDQKRLRQYDSDSSDKSPRPEVEDLSPQRIKGFFDFLSLPVTR